MVFLRQSVITAQLLKVKVFQIILYLFYLNAEFIGNFETFVFCNFSAINCDKIFLNLLLYLSILLWKSYHKRIKYTIRSQIPLSNFYASINQFYVVRKIMTPFPDTTCLYSLFYFIFCCYSPYGRNSMYYLQALPPTLSTEFLKERTDRAHKKKKFFFHELCLFST
jgi:hypothetical protein